MTQLSITAVDNKNLFSNFTLPSCASLSPNPSPRLSESRHWHRSTDSDFALCCYEPVTTNLRSSAFICGSFFAEAPDINCYKFIKASTSQNPSPQIHPIPPSCTDSEHMIQWMRTRMARIGRIFTGFLIRANPVRQGSYTMNCECAIPSIWDNLTRMCFCSNAEVQSSWDNVKTSKIQIGQFAKIRMSWRN